MKTLLLMLLLAVPLRANEIPGYPYDVLSKIGKDYTCYEAEQIQETYPIVYRICLANSVGGTPGSLLKNIAFQAFEEFVRRVVSQPFYDCLKKNSAPIALESREAFLKKWIFPGLSLRSLSGEAKAAADTGTNSLVFISGFEKSTPTLAEGYRNYFFNPLYKSEGIPWRQHISIAANTDFLASSSVAFGNDIDTWAALLGMAYFKNLGLSEEGEASIHSPSNALGRCLLTKGVSP